MQVGEIYTHLHQGLGLRDPHTKSKYVRLIKQLDGVEMKHLQAQRAKAMK